MLLGPVAKDFHEAERFAALITQGHHLAQGEEPFPVPAQVPSLVDAATGFEGGLYLRLGNSVSNSPQKGPLIGVQKGPR